MPVGLSWRFSAVPPRRGWWSADVSPGLPGSRAGPLPSLGFLPSSSLHCWPLWGITSHWAVSRGQRYPCYLLSFLWSGLAFGWSSRLSPRRHLWSPCAWRYSRWAPHTADIPEDWYPPPPIETKEVGRFTAVETGVTSPPTIETRPVRGVPGVGRYGAETEESVRRLREVAGSPVSEAPERRLPVVLVPGDLPPRALRR